jgi:hypothetical protein
MRTDGSPSPAPRRSGSPGSRPGSPISRYRLLRPSCRHRQQLPRRAGSGRPASSPPRTPAPPGPTHQDGGARPAEARAAPPEGGSNKVLFVWRAEKTMITMDSPDFVWINTNEIVSSWYLLGAVCVAPPTSRWASPPNARRIRSAGWPPASAPAGAAGAAPTATTPRRPAGSNLKSTGLTKNLGQL